MEGYTGCTTDSSPRKELTMVHVVEMAKDIDTAARDLEEAVKRNGFGVLPSMITGRSSRKRAPISSTSAEISLGCLFLTVPLPRESPDPYSTDSMEV